MDVNRGWGVGVRVVKNGARGSIQGFRLRELKHPTRGRVGRLLPWRLVLRSQAQAVDGSRFWNSGGREPWDGWNDRLPPGRDSVFVQPNADDWQVAIEPHPVTNPTFSCNTVFFSTTNMEFGTGKNLPVTALFVTFSQRGNLVQIVVNIASRRAYAPDHS